MPFYVCKVINDVGKEETKVVEASDVVAMKAALKADRYTLLKHTKIVEKKPNLFFSVSSKVKPQEVVTFLRQFAVMINATISIAESLETLKNQNFSSPFKKVLMEVHTDVLSGKLLSTAFDKHPDCFPHFFVEMVAIGEISGSLDSVLTSMADYYENDQKVQKKTKSALAYPKLLLIMIGIVIIFLSVVILPKFSTLFASYGGTIPKFTQVILNISLFIKTNIWYILTIGIAIFLSLKLFFMSKTGEAVADKIKIIIPVISSIHRATVVARFTKAFVILLRSGMTITDCLENLTRILENKVYVEKFKYSVEEVKRGKRIAKSIENTKLFPSMLTEMINVGERTGNLEEVLSSTTGFYESQVESTIARATALIEPAIIVILGLVVAVVLISVYVPMISLMETI